MVCADMFFDLSELGFDGKLEELRRLKFRQSVLFDESTKVLDLAYKAYEKGKQDEYLRLMKLFYEIREKEFEVANKLIKSIEEEIKNRKLP